MLDVLIKFNALILREMWICYSFSHVNRGIDTGTTQFWLVKLNAV